MIHLVICVTFEASPPPTNIEEDKVIPNNTPNPYAFPLSKVTATKTPGGSVKVIDSRTFKVADKISAVEVEVEAGGMRYATLLTETLSLMSYSGNYM
jgi:hypothetical protein